MTVAAVPRSRSGKEWASISLYSISTLAGAVSRQAFYAGIFFIFIATPKLEAPVFYTLDKLFLWISFLAWLVSPGFILGSFDGRFMRWLLAPPKESRPFAVMAVAFLALKLLDVSMQVAGGGINYFGAFGYTIQELAYLLVPVLMCVHIRTESDFVKSAWVLQAGIVLSSFVAIGIYFDISKVFLQLRDSMIFPNRLYPELGRLAFHHHQSGLAPAAYIFAYHLSLSVPVTACLMKLKNGSFRQATLVAGFLVQLVTLALVGTRMPLIGSVAAVLFMYSRQGKLKAKHMVLVALGIAAFAMVIMFAGLAIGDRFKAENLTLDFLDKIYAQIAAFVSLPDHPLGVGYGNLDSQEYVNALSSDIRLLHLPHFHFITCVLFWGYPGLFLSFVFCWAMFQVMKKFGSRKAIAALPEERRHLALLGFCGFVSVMINTVAHNPGPFFNDYTSWLSIGWIAAVFAGTGGLSEGPIGGAES